MRATRLEPIPVRPLCILVVEDDALIGTLLAEMLAIVGHSVCGLEITEAGAIRAALELRPDLMIVDVNLASGTGLSAVEQISRTVAIPHLFMSGNPLNLARASTIVLHKPFRMPELVHAIERTIAMAAA